MDSSSQDSPVTIDSGPEDVGGVEDSDPPYKGARLVVNEFMASNGGSLELEDETSPDWIELYNSGDIAVDLQGWFLSDSSENPDDYVFSDSQVLEPGDFALFYADAVEGVGHLPFNLSSEGEEIVLSRPDEVVHDWIAFEPQVEDISAARSPDGGSEWVFVPEGTPGASNG